jgi:acyl-CoA hydrolase
MDRVETTQGKRVAESAVVMSQLMLPSDANPWGNVHGGSIMKLVDSAAGVVATRHCRTRVVTARMDEMSFLEPVYIGNVVTLKASVNDTGRTSLEVGVRVEAEDLRSGRTWHVGSAYLVFVSLGDDGRPVPVPPLIAETEDEHRRRQAARDRHARRLRAQPT